MRNVYIVYIYIFIISRFPTDFAAFQNNAPRSSWWLSDPANCPSCVAVRTMINGCHLQLQRFIHLGLMSHRKDPGWHAILTWSLLLWRLLKRHFSNLIDSWHDRGSKNWVTNSQEIWDMGLSENRVYSQWNSHLIGIMISKTIGFRGTLFSDKPTCALDLRQSSRPRGSQLLGWLRWPPNFAEAMPSPNMGH